MTLRTCAVKSTTTTDMTSLLHNNTINYYRYVCTSYYKPNKAISIPKQAVVIPNISTTDHGGVNEKNMMIIHIVALIKEMEV
jgi:hypothetical protein